MQHYTDLLCHDKISLRGDKTRVQIKGEITHVLNTLFMNCYPNLCAQMMYLCVRKHIYVCLLSEALRMFAIDMLLTRKIPHLS